MASQKSQIALTMKTPLAQCARGIVLGYFTSMWRRKRGALAGGRREVHQMRVASRRLKVIMVDFAGALPKRGRRKLLHRVRTLTEALGAVRDLDILIRLLSRKRAGLPHPLRPGVAGLLRQCQNVRNRSRRHLRDYFRDLDEFRFEERFRRWLTA